MGQYLNVGNAGFGAIVKGQYVDKTGLIEYINHTLGTKEKLTCISRPRRFGKSFAAQMLCAYYDKSCDSEPLFSGLKISQSKSYREHLNQYDVIYLDMTSFMTEDYERKTVLRVMQDLVIRELQEQYPQVVCPEETLPAVLAAIAEKTGNKFIFIIDEWDVIFREAKEDTELQTEYIRLLRALFKDSGRTDKMIEAAYMTGILPVKKYGTQSAMTDFYEYTMLRPEPLEEYVGFTEEEVRGLCENSSLSFSDLQRWYDGYTLGNNTHIYSPKSVSDALKRGRLGNYWTQSETYESLQSYIDRDEDGLREAIVQMLAGKQIKLDVETFQNDMTSIRGKDDILTLLVHLGYLVYSYDSEAVSIPNEEVRREFIRAVKGGKRTELANLIKNSELLLEQTIHMDETAVAAAIERAHSAGTAPNFYNNEQALRSAIRFAYISCVDEYQEIQELPSGTGYADVVYIPKKGSSKPAMVVELKWNKTAKAAIRQIKDRNYPQILEGFTDKILLVGINYDEQTKAHSCCIECYREQKMER